MDQEPEGKLKLCLFPLALTATVWYTFQLLGVNVRVDAPRPMRLLASVSATETFDRGPVPSRTRRFTLPPPCTDSVSVSMSRDPLWNVCVTVSGTVLLATVS